MGERGAASGGGAVGQSSPIWKERGRGFALIFLDSNLGGSYFINQVEPKELVHVGASVWSRADGFSWAGLLAIPSTMPVSLPADC